MPKVIAMKQHKLWFFIGLLLLLGTGVLLMVNSMHTAKAYKYSINVGVPHKYDVLFDFDNNYFTDKDGQPMLRFTAVGGSPADSWGSGGQATLLSEVNPLPTGIKVRWFSVAEDQFWEGDYQFNQDLLQQLSQYQVNDVIDRDSYNFMDYLGFTVYVVPGGLVTVWISGGANIYILAQFQARKVEEKDWDTFADSVLQRGPDFHISRTDYIKERFNNPDSIMSTETKQELEQGKIPKDAAPWKRYMNTYQWVLTVNDEYLLKDYFTRYVSAEQYYTYSGESQYTLKPRPVPKEISFYIEDVTSKQLKRLNLYLDQEEIMSAFETFTKESISADPIKLHLSLDSPLTNIEVFLIKDHKSIELKKIKGTIDDLHIR